MLFVYTYHIHPASATPIDIPALTWLNFIHMELILLCHSPPMDCYSPPVFSLNPFSHTHIQPEKFNLVIIYWQDKLQKLLHKV